ncbi:cyclic GMP-AMP synthase [Paralichthys olivaceus]|uniref:cyclic GMP-AMP synthase n=1 Tax=Paralichthys olivaceus TaxID=8255 RepID=UPI00375022D7
MTGRGRPRKSASPQTECAKGKTTTEEYPENGFTEEKQNGTTRKQEPNHMEQNTQKKKTPTDDKEAPPRGSRAKIKGKSEVEITTPQPETPKDKKKDSAKAAKTKKCSDRAREEETETTQPKDTTKTSVKSTKAKTCAGKDKLPEDTMKTLPKASHVDSLLSKTLEKLKIKKSDKSNTAEVINNLIKHIIKHLKEKTACFEKVEALHTGSYYENVKISNPDEFDVMLSVPVDRVELKPFGDDGAFYSVGLKRDKNPLWKFQEGTILSANKMLTEFREEVKKCVKAFTDWEVTRKKPGCPAVTLTTTVESVTISLDVVLCIMVKTSWPPFTNEGFTIQGWLGTKVKQDYKRKPFYLVPKYEGRGSVEQDGVSARDTWRISFSHVEKGILMNHGSEKTCCEKQGQRCCRKDCLKLLKHLLSLLKERHSSLQKFYSYQAKTTLFHACSSRNKDSDWSVSDLRICFHQLLDDFIGYLENGVLPNFFIPSQNLLSGTDEKMRLSLAKYIKEERDNAFPIFTNTSCEI